MHHRFMTLSIILIKLSTLAHSCISLGGCGFAGCCDAGIPCARAKGTKLFRAGDDEGKSDKSIMSSEELLFIGNQASDSSIMNENDEFLSCCKNRGLPKPCLDKCSYLTYDKNALRKIFFRLDSCPLLAANDIHQCAGQNSDHRQCCRMNQVTDTLARNKCLIFCDQRPQNVTQLDITYLPCLERFESIKGCFWRQARERSRSPKSISTDKYQQSLEQFSPALQHTPAYPFMLMQ